MAGLGTRIVYSDYPTALLDLRFEDRRMLTRTAHGPALTRHQITQCAGHHSPAPMVSMAEKEGVDEERMEIPERRKSERRSATDRRKSERSTGVKRRKAQRRKTK